jgi:LmbE family N-acetylglucosaminyl deacetylase
MQRREFLGSTLVGSAALSSPATAAQGALRDTSERTDVVLEHEQPGQPHKGKVLAAIQPHADDIPLFSAGLILKLIKEGYTGVLIRITNSESAGRGKTIGEVIYKNETEHFELARRLGLPKVFDLNYRNHRLDGDSRLELRARLMFIFRAMKVDTVICYDPWGHYEENPDHYVTAQSVEAACWMSGGQWDYPEHFEVGLRPQSVREKYYFARGPQLVNRVVDISSVFDQKVYAAMANVTQGPAGESGARLRASLAGQGLKLPILGEDDQTANREYIKNFVLYEDAALGKQYGVAYAEPYHYIGPEIRVVDDYVKRNAVRI